jgi:glycosyltransferase
MPYRASEDTPTPAMDGLVDFFKSWSPELVIWDPVMPGAAVAARVVGARHARYTGPDYVGASLDLMERLTAGREVDNPLVETVRPMAERHGVPVDRETLYGQWTINPMPPAVNLPVSARMVPVQWIPHVTQGPLPEWLYPVPERPRIAVSLGVSTREYIKADWSHISILFEALSELDVDVVATLNAVQMENVVKVPDNVRVLDYFPLDQLVPTCEAVIHHGGLATMITAARAKVPQIVVDFLEFPIGATPNEDGSVSGSRYPLAPVTGGYILGHGAGEVMDLSRPSVEAIREQVSRVLSDAGLRAGARRLYEDLVLSPAPNAIVPILEQLVHTA